jgi:hypothetical protein
MSGYQNPASLHVHSEGETSDSCPGSAPASPPPLAPTADAAAAAVRRTSSRRRKTLSDQVSEILNSSSHPTGGTTRSGKSYKKEKRVRFDDKFSQEIAYKKGKSIFIF